MYNDIKKSMSDRTIIFNFLEIEFQNNHPLIYIYVCGEKRLQITVINKIMTITKKIFSPPLSDSFILEVVIDYLSDKEKLYEEGSIEITNTHIQPNDVG